MIESSFVICTKNRPKSLEKCLEHLLRQDYPVENLEVLICDSSESSYQDENKKIYERFKNKLPHFDVTILEYPDRTNSCKDNITYKKHALIKKAQGLYIFSLDDDAYIIDNCYINEAIKSLNRESISWVVGNIFPLNRIENKFISRSWHETPSGKVSNHFTLNDFGSVERVIEEPFIYTTNFAIKKENFYLYKGFGPDGFSGDFFMYNGSGENNLSGAIKGDNEINVLFNPFVSVFHDSTKNRNNWQYLYLRFSYFGIGASFDNVRQLKKTLASAALYKLYFKMIARLIKNILKFNLLGCIEIYAYETAFIAHQKCVNEHPILHDFILQDHWMDYDFSKLKPIKLKNRAWDWW